MKQFSQFCPLKPKLITPRTCLVNKKYKKVIIKDLKNPKKKKNKNTERRFLVKLHTEIISETFRKFSEKF